MGELSAEEKAANYRATMDAVPPEDQAAIHRVAALLRKRAMRMVKLAEGRRYTRKVPHELGGIRRVPNAEGVILRRNAERLLEASRLVAGLVWTEQEDENNG